MAQDPHEARLEQAGLPATRDLWLSCIERLAQELSEQLFNTWIKPLSAAVADDLSKVTIYVGNRFKLDWIRAQYSGRIARTLELMVGQPVALELALAALESNTRGIFIPSQPARILIDERPETRWRQTLTHSAGSLQDLRQSTTERLAT